MPEDITSGIGKFNETVQRWLDIDDTLATSKLCAFKKNRGIPLPPPPNSVNFSLSFLVETRKGKQATLAQQQLCDFMGFGA